jgi:cytidine deaminase
MEASLLSEIRTAGKVTTEHALVDLLPAAAELARPEISGYPVGAIALGASGAAYLGANLELPGMPLICALHAEQAAIAQALKHQEQGILALAVSAPPCGHCRQFLLELAASRSLVIVTPSGRMTLSDLLPAAFDSSELGRGGNLMQHGYQDLAIRVTADPVAEAAAWAAHVSYSPYTSSPSGVALQIADGRIVAGSYIESVAYNPSVSPMLAGLSTLALQGITPGEIRRAVLIEREDAVLSQMAFSRLILESCSGVTLELVPALVSSE